MISRSPANAPRRQGNAEIDREQERGAAAEPVDRQVHADSRRRRAAQRSVHPVAPSGVPHRRRSAEIDFARRDWRAFPSLDRTIRQPVSSIVSNVPSTVAAPVWIETRSPRPNARSSHRFRSRKSRGHCPSASESTPGIRSAVNSPPRRFERRAQPATSPASACPRAPQ